MGMNNHWLKFKISQFEEDWKAEFSMSFTLHTEGVQMPAHVGQQRRISFPG